MQTIISANGCSENTLTCVPDNTPERQQPVRRSCGGRTISAFTMAVSHIPLHIVFGAAKALELCISNPSNFLSHHGQRIGVRGGKLSKFFGFAGIFAGAIITTVVAVPSLLIGAVAGLGRCVYKFPSAMNTSWSDGIRTAISHTIESYNFNRNKVATVVIITMSIIATACFTPLLSLILGLSMRSALALVVTADIIGVTSTVCMTDGNTIARVALSSSENELMGL